MAQRQIRVKLAVCIVGVLALTAGCNTSGLFGGGQTVNTGELTRLTREEVCISHELPDGPEEKCFRIEDDIPRDAGLAPGDLVEVWFEGRVATEVRAVPPH